MDKEPIIDEPVASSNEPVNDEEIPSKDLTDYKWKEYTLYISHFRYYLDITLKTNVFFYLTTGGVVGYYLTSGDKEKVKYFFLLPILIGTALTGMFIYGANLWRKAYVNSQALKTNIEKNLGTKELPDTHLVYIYLWLSAIMFFIVGLSLAILPYFIGGSSWEYFTTSLGLLVIGRFIIPYFARMTDRRLKRERLLHSEIEDWEKFIRGTDFYISTIEKVSFYGTLHPFLRRRTRKGIKHKQFNKELLLEDIEQIKASIS